MYFNNIGTVFDFFSHHHGKERESDIYLNTLYAGDYEVAYKEKKTKIEELFHSLFAHIFSVPFVEGNLNIYKSSFSSSFFFFFNKKIKKKK